MTVIKMGKLQVPNTPLVVIVLAVTVYDVDDCKILGDPLIAPVVLLILKPLGKVALNDVSEEVGVNEGVAVGIEVLTVKIKGDAGE